MKPTAPSRAPALGSTVEEPPVAEAVLVLSLEVGVVAPVAVPEAVPEEAALLSHVTSSGRSVTPAVAQICLAYLTAVSLP